MGKWAKQMEAGVNPRFRHGSPGEVTLTPGSIRADGTTLTIAVPAHSVMAVELKGSMRSAPWRAKDVGNAGR